MAEIIMTLKIMPESPETDLEALEAGVKSKITEAVGESQFKVETEPIAFGLKAIKISFVIDESKGSQDELENDISEMEGVNSVEVVDVRRTIG